MLYYSTTGTGSGVTETDNIVPYTVNSTNNITISGSLPSMVSIGGHLYVVANQGSSTSAITPLGTAPAVEDNTLDLNLGGPADVSKIHYSGELYWTGPSGYPQPPTDWPLILYNPDSFDVIDNRNFNDKLTIIGASVSTNGSSCEKAHFVRCTITGTGYTNCVFYQCTITSTASLSNCTLIECQVNGPVYSSTLVKCIINHSGSNSNFYQCTGTPSAEFTDPSPSIDCINPMSRGHNNVNSSMANDLDSTTETGINLDYSITNQRLILPHPLFPSIYSKGATLPTTLPTDPWLHAPLNGTMATTNVTGTTNATWGDGGLITNNTKLTTIPSTHAKLAPRSDFTIMAYVKFNTVTPASFIAHDVGTGDQPKWIFGYVHPNLTFFEYSGYIVSAAWSPDNEWHHVAVTRSNTYYALFIDGVRVAEGNGGPAAIDDVPTTTPFTIGSAEGSFFFDGTIKDVRIYGRYMATVTPPEPITGGSSPGFIGC
jgi:hypothetical protein